MDSQNIVRQFLRAVLHELFRSKTTYNLLGSIILLGVVAFGYVWQEQYESRASVALAQGSSASGSNVRLNQLQNVFDTHVFQQEVVELLRATVFKGRVQGPNKESLAHDINTLWFEKNVSLSILPRGIAEIKFRAATPSNAQNALNITLNSLLENFQSSEDVASLHQLGDQLRQQEVELKNIIRQNEELLRIAGGLANDTFGSASSRANALREALQDVEISLSAVDASVEGIERRLQEEETLLDYTQKREQLHTQKQKNSDALSEALELYSSASPDVISLQQTLDNIALELAQLETEKPVNAGKLAASDAFYEKLRQKLTLQELEKESLESKRMSLQRLLASENKKALQDQDQINEVQKINERILSSKSKLDIVLREIAQLNLKLREEKERGGRFVVLDTASLPGAYTGLGFVEFLLLGPLLAFGLPFLVASVIVLTDSSIRTARGLERVHGEVAVLAVIPHYNSPKTLRLFRKAIIGLVAWIAFVFMVYITVGVIGLKG
ncbi:MAG: hypothetical protein K6L76_12570 [Agarilytica sp.]